MKNTLDCENKKLDVAEKKIKDDEDKIVETI